VVCGVCEEEHSQGQCKGVAGGEGTGTYSAPHLPHHHCPGPVSPVSPVSCTLAVWFACAFPCASLGAECTHACNRSLHPRPPAAPAPTDKGVAGLRPQQVGDEVEVEKDALHVCARVGRRVWGGDGGDRGGGLCRSSTR